MEMRAARGLRVLRATSVVVGVLVLVVGITVVYSVYVDYGAAVANLGQNSPHPPTLAVSINGSSETVTLTVTVDNPGLYSLRVSIVCGQEVASVGVLCEPAVVEVAPGNEGNLELTMSVANVTEFRNSGSMRVNGTVVIVLNPLASLRVDVDLAPFLTQGGG